MMMSFIVLSETKFSLSLSLSESLSLPPAVGAHDRRFDRCFCVLLFITAVPDTKLFLCGYLCVFITAVPIIHADRKRSGARYVLQPVLSLRRVESRKGK